MFIPYLHPLSVLLDDEDFDTELYQRVLPLAYADSAHGYALKRLCKALSLQLEDIELIIRDSSAGPGWSIIVNVDTAPLPYLPWLGQTVGVIALPRQPGEEDNLYADRLRQQIRQHNGFARGRPASMVAATQATLNGSQRVHLVERYQGSAYRALLVTYDSETPNPAATEAAARSQKPAAIKLIYEVHPGQSWNNLMATYATWNDVISNYATWSDVINAD